MTAGGGPWPSLMDSDAATRIARLIFYGLLSIVLMTLDYRGRYVDSIRTLSWRALEPVILAVEAPFAFGRRMGEELRSRHELMAQMTGLERRNRELSAELSLLEELRDDNRELRELLAATARVQPTFLSAELMGIDLNPWSHRVVINRGRSDGLLAGQPVMDGLDVLGQVDELGLHTAQVILISDPDHALPVRVQRTGLRTVTYGSGRVNELRLTDLPMNVDLVAGDVLLTSGLGGAFPAGLPVAEIVSVARPHGEAFALAHARPLGRLDRARHVLIVESIVESSADPDDDTPEPATARPDAADSEPAADPEPEVEP